MTSPVTFQSLAALCVENAEKSWLFPFKIAWVRQAADLVHEDKHKSFAEVLDEYKDIARITAEAFKTYSEALREQARAQSATPQPTVERQAPK